MPSLEYIIPLVLKNTNQSSPLFGQQYQTVLTNFLSVGLLELCAILKKLQIKVSELWN